MKSAKVVAIAGDIGVVKADALITAINSGGLWFGGVDQVISSRAGNRFHQQVANLLPNLKHLDTVVAKKTRKHRGAFGDVIFVIDDLEGPLSKIILAGLAAADLAGYKKVTLPAIRTGVMLGQIEKNIQQTVTESIRGIKKFLRVNKNSEKITFVIYDSPIILGEFKKQLQSL